MNTQPSAEEQVTVNVVFLKGDQFLNASVVAMETKQHSVLSKMLQYTWEGWPDNPVLQLY